MVKVLELGFYALWSHCLDPVSVFLEALAVEVVDGLHVGLDRVEYVFVDLGSILLQLALVGQLQYLMQEIVQIVQ